MVYLVCQPRFSHTDPNHKWLSCHGGLKLRTCLTINIPIIVLGEVTTVPGIAVPGVMNGFAVVVEIGFVGVVVLIEILFCSPFTLALSFVVPSSLYPSHSFQIP